MKKKIIDCSNGPVIVADFCLVQIPRKIEVRIGVERRGKGRWAALTPRQASDLVIALQEALRDRLPEEQERRTEVVMSPDSSSAGVVH